MAAINNITVDCTPAPKLTNRNVAFSTGLLKLYMTKKSGGDHGESLPRVAHTGVWEKGGVLCCDS